MEIQENVWGGMMKREQFQKYLTVASAKYNLCLPCICDGRHVDLYQLYLLTRRFKATDDTSYDNNKAEWRKISNLMGYSLFTSHLHAFYVKYIRDGVFKCTPKQSKFPSEDGQKLPTDTSQLKGTVFLKTSQPSKNSPKNGNPPKNTSSLKTPYKAPFKAMPTPSSKPHPRIQQRPLSAKKIKADPTLSINKPPKNRASGPMNSTKKEPIACPKGSELVYDGKYRIPYLVDNGNLLTVSTKPEKLNMNPVLRQLESGLPNEQAFALNLLLWSTKTWPLPLAKYPRFLTALLVTTGFVPNKLYERYRDEDVMEQFWNEALNDECYFGTDERPRVIATQVSTIFYNISCVVSNAEFMGSNPNFVKYILQGLQSRCITVRNTSYETFINIVSKMSYEVLEQNKDAVFAVPKECIVSQDRFLLLAGLETISGLASHEQSLAMLDSHFSKPEIEIILRILLIPDVQILHAALETVYNLSSLGRGWCAKFLSFSYCISTLKAHLSTKAELLNHDNVQVMKFRSLRAVPIAKATAFPNNKNELTTEDRHAIALKTRVTEIVDLSQEEAKSWIKSNLKYNRNSIILKSSIYVRYKKQALLDNVSKVLDPKNFFLTLNSIIPKLENMKITINKAQQFVLKNIDWVNFATLKPLSRTTKSTTPRPLKETVTQATQFTSTRPVGKHQTSLSSKQYIRDNLSEKQTTKRPVTKGQTSASASSKAAIVIEEVVEISDDSLKDPEMKNHTPYKTGASAMPPTPNSLNSLPVKRTFMRRGTHLSSFPPPSTPNQTPQSPVQPQYTKYKKTMVLDLNGPPEKSNVKYDDEEDELLEVAAKANKSASPTFDGTSSPTFDRTSSPTFDKTSSPTFDKTSSPTFDKTSSPTFDKASSPTFDKTSSPTFETTTSPTFEKCSSPTLNKTASPTFEKVSSPRFDDAKDEKLSTYVKKSDPVMEECKSPIFKKSNETNTRSPIFDTPPSNSVPIDTSLSVAPSFKHITPSKSEGRTASADVKPSNTERNKRKHDCVAVKNPKYNGISKKLRFEDDILVARGKGSREYNLTAEEEPVAVKLNALPDGPLDLFEVVERKNVKAEVPSTVCRMTKNEILTTGPSTTIKTNFVEASPVAPVTPTVPIVTASPVKVLLPRSTPASPCYPTNVIVSTTPVSLVPASVSVVPTSIVVPVTPVSGGVVASSQPVVLAPAAPPPVLMQVVQPTPNISGAVPTILAQSPGAGPTILAQSPGAGPTILAQSPGAGPSILAQSPRAGPTILAHSPRAGPTILAQSPGTGPTILAQSPRAGPTILAQSPRAGPTILAQSPGAGPTILAQSPGTAVLMPPQPILLATSGAPPSIQLSAAPAVTPLIIASSPIKCQKKYLVPVSLVSTGGSMCTTTTTTTMYHSPVASTSVSNVAATPSVVTPAVTPTVMTSKLASRTPAAENENKKLHVLKMTSKLAPRTPAAENENKKLHVLKTAPPSAPPALPRKRKVILSPRSETYPCYWEGCSRGYYSQDELYRHLLKDHVPVSPTSCKWITCQEKTNTRSRLSLIFHVRKVHSVAPHLSDLSSGEALPREGEWKESLRSPVTSSIRLLVSLILRNFLRLTPELVMNLEEEMFAMAAMSDHSANKVSCDILSILSENDHDITSRVADLSYLPPGR